MLRINRLRIVVNTEKGKFGFDEKFDKKVNFIGSNTNTKGKSSCIEAIYYCLGLEELIGGRNEKALKPVFRDKLYYENRQVNVLESEFYIEVENSNKEINTIYRPGKKRFEKANLVKIFNGSLQESIQGKLQYEDMYVHMAGSATNRRGFHRYLESFMGIELPEVPSYDDVNRKLYLQVIFSAIFTEQKRGWADLFASMPTYFKIRESKKRVVEYLIGLDSLEVEQKRQKYKDIENNIKKEWEKEYSNIRLMMNKKKCTVKNINSKPEIINEDKQYCIYKEIGNGEQVHIEDYILKLRTKLEKVNTDSNTIGKNINELQEQIGIKQSELLKKEGVLIQEKKKLLYDESNIDNLEESLKSIELDLENNKDVKKIKNLGSTKEWDICNEVCPTCNQEIKDILLPQNLKISVMNVDENIKHLEAQKAMIEFTLKNYKKNKTITENNISIVEENIVRDRKILRSIKKDLYSVDDNISETVIRKKIMIENEIDNMETMQAEIDDLYQVIKNLSSEWKENIDNMSKLPESNFTEMDLRKIKDLREYFIKNLQLYGYKSISDFSQVEISKEKLMPVISGFDMKFDSSASDNIRAIWAFNVALMQTSLKNNGNHPSILIFDEPGQQSMVISDLCSFIDILSNIDKEIQIIIGITIDNDEIFKTIKEMDEDKYSLIMIDDKSIAPLK